MSTTPQLVHCSLQRRIPSRGGQIQDVMADKESVRVRKRKRKPFFVARLTVTHAPLRNLTIRTDTSMTCNCGLRSSRTAFGILLYSRTLRSVHISTYINGYDRLQVFEQDDLPLSPSSVRLQPSYLYPVPFDRFRSHYRERIFGSSPKGLTSLTMIKTVRVSMPTPSV